MWRLDYYLLFVYFFLLQLIVERCTIEKIFLIRYARGLGFRVFILVFRYRAVYNRNITIHRIDKWKIAQFKQYSNSAAWSCKFNGIIDEVNENLHISATVSVNTLEKYLVFRIDKYRSDQFDLFGLWLFTIGGQTLFYDTLEVKVLIDYTKRAIAKLGKVHEISHQHHRHLRLWLYFFELFLEVDLEFEVVLSNFYQQTSLYHDVL